jgi:uncharacterized membrane protein
MVKKDKGEIKACAILSYVLFGIIWFFVDDKMRKNKFCRFHAQQGAVFLIFYILWGIAVTIFISIFNGLAALAAYSGTFLALGLFGSVIALLGFVAWIIPLVLLVIGMVNAANNKTKELPIIGKYGKKFKF